MGKKLVTAKKDFIVFLLPGGCTRPDRRKKESFCRWDELKKTIS